jgi:hypothetical protein
VTQRSVMGRYSFYITKKEVRGMKAIINGISVEGTPQEIMDYKKLEESNKSKEAISKLCNWPPYVAPEVKCPNDGKPCYCKGACMCSDGTSGSTNWSKKIKVTSY